MLDIVTARAEPEAGGRHCDPARGGRSKRINVGEAALPKMPNKLKNA